MNKNKETQVKVSVIVPIYNVEDYLEKCIETIVSQTYKNIEIILVDDGATDGCPKICDKWAKKDDRIKVIHKKNGGLSDARNAGLSESTGEYICFVDSDDYIENTCIENLIKLILTNNADISIANRYIVKDGREERHTYYKPVIKNNLSSEELIRMFALDIVPHEAWCKIYKKETVFKKAKYKKGLKVFEDIEFILNVLKTEKLVINCDTSLHLYYYRDRDTSIMKEKFNDLWNDELLFYYKLYDLEADDETKRALAICTLKYCTRNIDRIINDLSIDKTMLTKTLNTIRSCLKISIFQHIKTIGKKRCLKLYIAKYFPYIITLYRQLKVIMTQLRTIRIRKYINKQRKQGRKLHLIFNAPTTGNIGDHAIIFGEEKYLRGKGNIPLSISSKEMKYFFDAKLENLVNKEDNIYVTGGGNMGTLWRNEQNRINCVLKTFKENPIIIFPQTIFYSSDEYGQLCLKEDLKYYKSCEKLKIYCRDQESYTFVKTAIEANTQMVKDMALMLDYRNYYNYNRRGVAICFRNDKEKNMTDEDRNKIIERIKCKYPNENIIYIDTLKTNKREYTYNQGKKEFIKLIKQMSKVKLVITDRLHGMLLSVISGTPCIAFNNSSGKVKGVYDTIKSDDTNIRFMETKDYDKI